MNPRYIRALPMRLFVQPDRRGLFIVGENHGVVICFINLAGDSAGIGELR